MSATDTTTPDDMSTSRNYKVLVDELIEKMNAGDFFAQRVVGAMALLASGWRYGDPDPVEPDDGDDGELVSVPCEIDDCEVVVLLRRRAA